jgi:hypothetical protein
MALKTYDEFVEYLTSKAMPDFASQCQHLDSVEAKKRLKMLKGNFKNKVAEFEIRSGTSLLMRRG